MINEAKPLVWTDPKWLEQAHAWIRASLGELDLAVTGEIVQSHIRPWSTIMRVPTSQGLVYFKASGQKATHDLTATSGSYISNEAALTQALYYWRPDCMVRVLAAHLENSWMLMADEGEMLRTRMKSPEDLYHWRHLLPLFAQVQIEMSGRGQELLALGVNDRHLALLPGLFQQMLMDRELLRLGREDGLSEAQYSQLQGIVPQYVGMCSELASTPIPQSLHHDDFHDGNVYISDDRYAFSDWEESLWTYPFFSIIITLRGITDRMGWPEDVTESPGRFNHELNQLRDLYLGPWTQFAPLPELREIFSLAWRVGMVNRAITWYLFLKQSSEADRETYGYTVPAWLQEFLLTV